MSDKPDFSNHEVLVRSIRHDISLLLEDYMIELRSQKVSNDADNLLSILGSIQATIQEFYKQGIGDRETAMLYYGIADRIVGNAYDKGKLNNLVRRTKK